jgi:uncharacterized protein (UPF0262 family)
VFRRILKINSTQNHVLVEIRIHEPVWEATARERRREWRQLIVEMLEQQVSDGSAASRLVITPSAVDGTILGFETLGGVTESTLVLPFDALKPHFREYCDICHRMGMLDEGSHSARLEALDMGKKLAHDRAARALLGLCAPRLSDHATARCFFSLLVSLHVDTTKMLNGHRVT